MTVTEFANKYGIKRPMVYEASFRTETRRKNGTTTDIPENELMNAVYSLLLSRSRYHAERMQEIEHMQYLLKKKTYEEKNDG